MAKGTSTFSDTTFRKALQILMGVALLGWLDALYSLWHREGLLSEGMAQKSFCNVSAVFNCDVVALSNYSAIGGIPTSVLGMFFYAVLIVVAIQTSFAASDRREKDATQGATILLLVSAFALVPTVALALVSVTVLKTLCLMCFVTYLINVVIAFVAWRTWRARPQSAASPSAAFSPPPTKAIATAIVLAGLHALAPAIARTSLGPGIDDSMLNAIVQKHLAEPVRTFNTEGFPVRGPKDAPITVIEFSDFQCPHCARAAITLPEIIRGYGDKIRLIHKDYPLDSSCNPKMTSSGHAMACSAAKTGRCLFLAKGDEAFHLYAETVFSNQSKLNEEFLKRTALSHGIAEGELETCLKDYATHQAIVEQAQEGTAAGIQGTPSIYVNGRLVEYGVVPKVLKRVLELYLTK